MKIILVVVVVVVLLLLLSLILLLLLIIMIIIIMIIIIPAPTSQRSRALTADPLFQIRPQNEAIRSKERDPNSKDNSLIRKETSTHKGFRSTFVALFSYSGAFVRVRVPLFATQATNGVQCPLPLPR